ncbi:MAG: hypothetical protein ACRD08_13970, partial [Acidimicrobiales bacterium]
PRRSAVDPRDSREFADEAGEVWTVTRDTGVRFGVSTDGPLPPGARGLRFTNSTGGRRFLASGRDDLPSRQELEALSEAQLRDLLRLAT